MNNNKSIKLIRRILLASFLVLITSEAYMHQVKGSGESPSIHALCPYGALESLYSIIFSGNYIQKIFLGTMTLLAITFILSIIFRRSFCGLICPFGALQEFFGLASKKIFHKRFLVPLQIDKPLRYLKYIVLIVTLLFAWKTSGLWMDPYDPWIAFAHISAGLPSLIDEYPIAFILLIITLLGSMLYDRFFCKYLCPMGAVYAIVSKISPSKIVRNKDKCINCNLCSKNCPVNIDVAQCEKVTSSECLSCQSCILSCPKKGALEYKISGKAPKTLTVILFSMIIFWGGLLASKSAGLFEVLPKPVSSGTIVNTEEIKGYMTIKEVSIGTGFDLKDLYEKLELPESIPEDTKLKDVKNYISDFEVENVREKLK